MKAVTKKKVTSWLPGTSGRNKMNEFQEEKRRRGILEFTGKYRFLSNFYLVEITFEGIRYPSVENAYQAAKTTDVEARQMFQTCSPGQAKKWGGPNGRIRIQDGWDQKKVGVMEYLLKKKFAEYPLRDALLATGDAQLAEGNWWGDTFWGTVNGKGKNWLGKTLSKVRKEIQEEVEE